MTQDEIIELAKQTHLPYFWETGVLCNLSGLEAFAKLITEKEREKILAVLRRKPDQQIYKVLDEIRGMK